MRAVLAFAAVTAVVVSGSLAWAFWSTNGSGAASAAATTLSGPTGVVATTTSGLGTVPVSWVAPPVPGGGPVDGYFVERLAGAGASPACATSALALHSSTSCDDLAVADGTYAYRVTAVFRTWTAESAPSNTVTVVNDIAVPTATITFPADGATTSSGAFAAGCSPIGLCGMAADDLSGVAAVRVSIRQGSGDWWGGSAFDQAAEFFVATTLDTPGGLSGSWSYPLAQPVDGPYTLHVQAVDAAGNTQSPGVYAATSSFTVDATAPTVSVTEVNGNTVSFPFATAAASLTSVGGVCGTAAGDSATVAVAITGPGTQDGTATCSSGTWTYDLAPALSTQGAYTVTASQSDTAANVGSSGASAVTLDSVAPVVTLDSVNGAAATFPLLTNSFTSLGGACGTAPGDSATVNVAITGAAAQSGTAPCAAGVWTWTPSPALSAQGAYSATATQSDHAANTGTSGARTVTLDSVAPAVTLTRVNGTDRTFPYATRVNVTTVGGSCGMAAGDSATVNVAVTGAASQSGSATCSSGSWTRTFTTALSIDGGTYSVTATQADTAANTGTAGPASILVDKTAPTVTWSLAPGATNAVLNGTTVSVDPDLSGSFRLVATVSDAASGPASVLYPALSASGYTHTVETVTTPTGGPYTSGAFSFTSSAGNRSYTGVVVSDGAGNTTTVTLTFNDDDSDPTGTITAPDDEDFVQGVVSVTSNSADTGGGVASAQFQVKSVSTGTWSNLGAADTSAPYAATWTTTTGFPDGRYDLRVTTTDVFGNAATSGTVQVDVQNAAPTPTSVVLKRNSGTAGRVEIDDQIIVTYSQSLHVNSLCSAWSASGDRSDQSITTNNAVTVSVADGGASSDSLTVNSTTCTGGFKFGTIDLGATGYATGGPLAFSGSSSSRSEISWDESTRTLTITLGAKSGAGSQGTVASSTATYTPNAAITNAFGAAMTGTFATATVAQF